VGPIPGEIGGGGHQTIKEGVFGVFGGGRELLKERGGALKKCVSMEGLVVGSQNEGKLGEGRGTKKIHESWGGAKRGEAFLRDREAGAKKASLQKKGVHSPRRKGHKKKEGGEICTWRGRGGPGGKGRKGKLVGLQKVQNIEKKKPLLHWKRGAPALYDPEQGEKEGVYKI